MRRRQGAALVLACVPFIAVCFSVALWDRLTPTVFGVPFNMAWLIAWIPLSSLCLWGIYRMRK